MLKYKEKNMRNCKIMVFSNFVHQWTTSEFVRYHDFSGTFSIIFIENMSWLFRNSKHGLAVWNSNGLLFRNNKPKSLLFRIGSAGLQFRQQA